MAIAAKRVASTATTFAARTEDSTASTRSTAMVGIRVKMSESETPSATSKTTTLHAVRCKPTYVCPRMCSGFTSESDIWYVSLAWYTLVAAYDTWYTV